MASTKGGKTKKSTGKAGKSAARGATRTTKKPARKAGSKSSKAKGSTTRKSSAKRTTSKK
jgi:hypothetical protein